MGSHGILFLGDLGGSQQTNSLPENLETKWDIEQIRSASAGMVFARKQHIIINSASPHNEISICKGIIKVNLDTEYNFALMISGRW